MFSESLWKGLLIDYLLIIIGGIGTFFIMINNNLESFNILIKALIYSCILMMILITIIEIIFYYLER